MDREAWRAAIHGVTKRWTQLSDWNDWLTDWLHFGLFCWPWWLLQFSKGFLPTVVDVIVICLSLNSPIPVTFSLLIPKMLMFTLAISSLTTPNLPWFMDLTFQVPMHLLPSAVTSTTGCCFCFGFIPSFLLELFLHWSPVAHWAPTHLGSSSFSVLPFWLVILFMRLSRQEYRSGLLLPSPVDHILSELSIMTRLSWVALHALAHSFAELDKGVIRLVSFPWL